MAEGLKIVNGDWSVDANGGVRRVTKADKLSRDFGKMLVTDAETPQNQTTYYRYNPIYGNYVNNPALFSTLSKEGRLNAVIELMHNTIQNYLNLQEERTNLSLAEIIADVEFDAYYDIYDPTKIIIPIRITNGEGLDLPESEFEQRVS